MDVSSVLVQCLTPTCSLKPWSGCLYEQHESHMFLPLQMLSGGEPLDVGELHCPRGKHQGAVVACKALTWANTQLHTCVNKKKNPQQHLLLYNPQSKEAFLKGCMKTHCAFKMTYFRRLVAWLLSVFLSPFYFPSSLLIVMRILRRWGKYWRVAGTDLNTRKLWQWFNSVCAKNRALIPKWLWFSLNNLKNIWPLHEHTTNVFFPCFSFLPFFFWCSF